MPRTGRKWRKCRRSSEGSDERQIIGKVLTARLEKEEEIKRGNINRIEKSTAQD